MWNKLRYKYAKLIYILFFHEWNPRLANSPELSQEFLDTFKIYRFQEPIEVSDIAKNSAIIWSRTSKPHTKDNLAVLIEQAIYKSRNRADKK